jgi:hypothetical protein
MAPSHVHFAASLNSDIAAGVGQFVVEVSEVSAQQEDEDVDHDEYCRNYAYVE